MCIDCTIEYEEYSGVICPICSTECNFEVWTAADSTRPVTVRYIGNYGIRFDGRWKQVLFCNKYPNYPQYLVASIGNTSHTNCQNRDDNFEWVHFRLQFKT